MAAEVTTRPPPTGEGLTYEKVWAMFQETDRKMQESAERLKQEMKERDEQREKQRKEFEQEMAERDRRFDKQLGKLGNRFGEMVEYMVMPNLITKFREMGFVFTMAYPHTVINDHVNDIHTEIDITLENGDKVMIVEVKSKPTTEDITEHVERMRKVRTRADLRGDRRKYLGAVAGMVFNENEKTFAMKNGFYVVEPSRGEPSPLCGSVEDTGETFIITAPEGEYSPREW